MRHHLALVFRDKEAREPLEYGLFITIVMMAMVSAIAAFVNG